VWKPCDRGHDLGPAILVEFEHRGKIFRLEQRFSKTGVPFGRKAGEQIQTTCPQQKAEERVGDAPGRSAYGRSLQA